MATFVNYDKIGGISTTKSIWREKWSVSLEFEVIFKIN